MRKVIASSLVVGMLGVWASPALAAEGDAPGAAKPADAGAPAAGGAAAPAPAAAPAAAEPGAPAEAEGAPASGTAPEKDAALVADAEAGGSPVELPGKTYLFVGARYRAMIMPKFMINMFGDGGETMVFHGFGPEFSIRKNAFEYNLSIWYAGYGFSDVAFKSKTDGPRAWEIVDSSLKSIYLTADFLWSQDFTPEFALNYGVGAGFGIIFGDLTRTQAYPGPDGDDNTGEGFVRCSSDMEPNDPGDYCDESNGHYNGYKEPSWANGGSKPLIFPWLVLQTGFRYKPHKNFVARFDAGFGTSGFFLGLGADYGL